MRNIFDLTYDELNEYMTGIGEKAFRTKQIYEWLYKGKTFEEMTNISKDLRQKLSDEFVVYYPEVVRVLTSKIDGTQKYLLKLSDGNLIETVVMKYKYGYSICISTQVGCRMGCAFCASTIAGFVRNLSSGEIMSQILFAQKELGERISHIVIMGIGEPFDNFDNLMKFLLNAKQGLEISYRNVTISTCGLLDKIEELADFEIPITLAVSLHAPNDEIRKKIMPIARAVDIDELLETCKEYFRKSGRRITFEYSLIKGVNDSEENAKELAKRLEGFVCHVNLIPVNEVKETGFIKTDKKTIEIFLQTLQKAGVAATVRRELGSDINASCGQLRIG